MVSGTGSFIYSQRDIPQAAPAPPFAANSAVNGLSVNGAGQIVFGDAIGGGLADFLNDREIDMSNFFFRFINGVDEVMRVDPLADVFIFGNLNTTGTYFYNDAAGFEIASNNAPAIGQNAYIYQFGDYGGTQNDTSLRIDDNAQLAQVLFGTDAYLHLDFANNIFALGDYTNFINPVFVAEVTGVGSPVASMYTQNPAGTLTAYTETAIANGALQPRFLSQLVGAATNSEIRLIEDKFNVSFDTGGTNDPLLFVDRANNTYWLGDVVAGANQSYIYIDNFGADISSASNQMFALDDTNKRYRMGDLDATVNGSFIEVDDNNNLLIIKNTANNLGIQINGVAGFTGVVAPVNTITVNNGIVTNVA